MNLTFIKVNFIIFEIVSIILLCVSIGALVYFSVFISLKSRMKKENFEIIQVSYNFKPQIGVFSDFSLSISESSPNLNSAYIILNKADFKNNPIEKIIDKINKSNPSNIFLFKHQKQARNLISKISNTLSTSNNFFNWAIGFLIILFFVFMKITLVRTSIKKIQLMKSNRVSHSILGTVKKDNSKILFDPSLSLLTKENIFNFCIFHATYLLIIPFLFPNLLDYVVNDYIGFRNNFFSSVYYYRSNFGQIDFESNPNFLGKEELSAKFILHHYDDFMKYTPSQINHYLLNLSFLCCSVWVSQYYNVFNTKQIGTSTMEKKKESKLKSYLNLGVVFILFLIWGTFLSFALVTFLDYFYLFHGLIIFSFIKITDPFILVFLIVFYYHVYLYALMSIYTFRIIYKNKQYEITQSENRKEEDEKSKSDLDLRLLPDSDFIEIVIDKKISNDLIDIDNNESYD